MLATLALDLGTKTGFAARSSGGLVSSGSRSFARGPHDGEGRLYLNFTEWLFEITAEADRVYFEKVIRHIGGDAAHIYGGFRACLLAFCEKNKIPCEGIHYATIKKSWTGKGNAKKDAMIAAARYRGYNPKDDNEADALALLTWATSRP